MCKGQIIFSRCSRPRILVRMFPEISVGRKADRFEKQLPFPSLPVQRKDAGVSSVVWVLHYGRVCTGRCGLHLACHSRSICSHRATRRNGVLFWGRLSLMGSDRNFITSLKAELPPHSFRPTLESRFARQTSGVDTMREDEETCLMILHFWKLACSVCLRVLYVPHTVHPKCGITLSQW